MKATKVKIDLTTIGIFRKASSKDIVEGNTVFLVADGDNLIRMTVEEVLRPNDLHKAFIYDGCRYGLDGLYVLLSNSELVSEMQRLQSIINTINELLNP